LPVGLARRVMMAVRAAGPLGGQITTIIIISVIIVVVVCYSHQRARWPIDSREAPKHTLAEDRSGPPPVAPARGSRPSRSTARLLPERRPSAELVRPAARLSLIIIRAQRPAGQPSSDGLDERPAPRRARAALDLVRPAGRQACVLTELIMRTAQLLINSSGERDAIG
jgi:hypothetical protein